MRRDVAAALMLTLAAVMFALPPAADPGGTPDRPAIALNIE